MSSVVAVTLSSTQTRGDKYCCDTALLVSICSIRQPWPHIFIFSLSHLLQLCPATCTLWNLSCRSSSKLSWRQITTLSKYYYLCFVLYLFALSTSLCCLWMAHVSRLLLTQSADTVCRSQRACYTLWAANIQFEPFIDSVWGCDENGSL